MREERIENELANFGPDTRAAGIDLERVLGDPTRLVGFISGTGGTPHARGRFKIDIHIPYDYPLRAPVMRFITPIWHPNIDGDGKFFMELIEHWSPAITLKTALLSLQYLLSKPKPHLSKNKAAKQMFDDFSQYLFDAEILTAIFANDSSTTKFEAALINLIAMGFTEEKARSSLILCSGDQNKAHNFLISASHVETDDADSEGTNLENILGGKVPAGESDKQRREHLQDSPSTENSEPREQTRRQIEWNVGLPIKLFNILQVPELQHVISWNATGDSFIIYNKLEFEKKILRQYFSYATCKTFLKKLHLYGFNSSKIENTICCSHPQFNQNNKEAAYSIPSPPGLEQFSMKREVAAIRKEIAEVSKTLSEKIDRFTETTMVKMVEDMKVYIQKTVNKSGANHDADCGKRAENAQPSSEDVRRVLRDLMTEDYCTATVDYYLKGLGSFFNTSLVDRREEVMQMINELLTEGADRVMAAMEKQEQEEEAARRRMEEEETS